MASVVIAPIAQALKYHGAKTPIGSKLRSRQWQETVPVQIREISQASAGVESARVLQRIQDGIGDILGHRRNELGGLTDRSGLMRDIMNLATREGIRPSTDDSKRGTIEDIGSEARTALIYEMQTGSAYGYANWEAGQDADMLDAYPAQELVRVRQAKEPRDWDTRWRAAAQKVGFDGVAKGPKVALKSSPIWVALSRFERAYPPFDFGSGMWVEDVDREAAVRLGLIKVSEKVRPQEKPFAENWQTSVENLSKELLDSLLRAFPDRVKIVGDKAAWTDKAASDSVPAVPDVPDVPAEIVDLDPTAEPKRFTTPEDGRKWADNAINPMEQGFSDPEIDALKKAQSNTNPINNPLWTGGELTPELRTWAKQISSAIKHGPRLPNMEVYHYSDAKWWGQYKLGSTVTLAGFTSTTLAENPAVEKEFGRGAIVKFRISAGKRAVYQGRIRGEPKYDYQAEILFDANTKVVIKNKVLKDRVWYIEADVL